MEGRSHRASLSRRRTGDRHRHFHLYEIPQSLVHVVSGAEPASDNKPESRMLFLQIGMLIVPFGLILFAWTAEKQQHWALPLLGAAIFASGIVMAFVCVQTYLADVYGEYSASALAAMIAARSIGSCVFSVVGSQLYVSLGYGWSVFPFFAKFFSRDLY